VIWFTRGSIGSNTISNITQILVEVVSSLKLKKIINKSSREIGIPCIGEMYLHMEKSMSIIGHQDPKSYDKYNKEEVDLLNKVIQLVILREAPP